jgi:hypothetical protein
MEQMPNEYQRIIQPDQVRNEIDDDLDRFTFYGLLIDKRTRLMVVLIGALSTLLPWYFLPYYDGLYLNLFSGLLSYGNVGYQLAAMLFYVGLLSCTFEGEEWSLLGGLIMAGAIIMGSLSVQNLPGIGLGMIIGILVTIYAFLPVIYALFEVMGDLD